MSHPAELERLALNIFHLHPDPDLCAQQYVDDHVGKIFIETCQMLSTAVQHVAATYSIRLSDYMYRPVYVNHPMNMWVRESYSNWYWTILHSLALSREFTFRFGGIHRSHGGCLDAVMADEVNLMMHHQLPFDRTPFPLCMPEHYKAYDDPYWSYRLYYKYGKSHLHRWTKRPRPDWLDLIPEYQEIYK